MSDAKDAKEPEPVRLPPQPPMDMRAASDEIADNGSIQAKDLAWNTRPHNEPAEGTQPSESTDESTDDE